MRRLASFQQQSGDSKQQITLVLFFERYARGEGGAELAELELNLRRGGREQWL